LTELYPETSAEAWEPYPGSGIGRIVTRDGRVVWEEAL